MSVLGGFARRTLPASARGQWSRQARVARSDYEHVDMLCIGLSWRSSHTAYSAYETALQRRAAALGVPVEIRWLGGPTRPSPESLLAGLNGIVFTGGPDVEPARYGQADTQGVCETDEARDADEYALLEHLAGTPLPLLAICRGAQLLNVFHGGTLIHDLAERNPRHKGPPDKSHEVTIQAGTALAAIARTGAATVNSSHHQAVDRLAAPFRQSAVAPDGTLEAYEYAAAGAQPFLLAVQWHPERMESGLAVSDGILDAFIGSMRPEKSRWASNSSFSEA